MTSEERGDLHRMSFELGRVAKGHEDLNKLFEQHCGDDDRRHGENVELLKANNDAIKALADALAPIAANHKWRLALFASVGMGALIMLSWATEVLVKWAFGWLLKIKFGG